MLKRTVTGLIGLPLMIILFIIGGIPLLIGMFALSVIGMSELFKAVSAKRSPAHYAAYAYAVVYYGLLINLSTPFIPAELFGLLLFSLAASFVMVMLMVMVVYHRKVNIMDCAISVFGLFYVAFLMSFVCLVRAHDYGQYFAWLIFICAWGCDTGAYFTGTFFGKHKLTPVLSPKKTIEGAIGGVVIAGLIALVFGLILSKAFLPNDEIRIVLFCAITGVIGAICSQFGDLAASAIKRYTKIKDYGHLIPGHGGVMDRFDSILFTAPVVYIVMIILLGI